MPDTGSFIGRNLGDGHEIPNANGQGRSTADANSDVADSSVISTAETSFNGMRSEVRHDEE